MSDASFPSRVDRWLIIVVALGLGMTLLQSLWAYQADPTAGLIGFAVAAGMVGLAFVVAVPCTYTLGQTHLIIRAGLIRQRIAYLDITDVEPSRSVWSAPALSLHRVKIGFAGRFQLVSPSDRDRFIHALRERVRAAQGGLTS
jgi:hypothetical protein